MDGTTPCSVALIIGSTRNPRIGRAVTETVLEIIRTSGHTTGIQLPIIDLADFNLPVYDEPVIPMDVPKRAQFTHEHSKRWSNEINKHEGYILISPEYNYGIPGGVKNAIDYLRNEWLGKPIAIVTYGVTGGSFCSEMLYQVLSKMGLKVAEARPQLPFKESDALLSLTGKLGDSSTWSWRAEMAQVLWAAFEEVKGHVIKQLPPNE